MAFSPDGLSSNSHQKQLSLSDDNLAGDLNGLASNDPKPRLRWTPELHDHFVKAVTQLGGADSMLWFSLFFNFAKDSRIH
jgi:hypothetical protein